MRKYILLALLLVMTLSGCADDPNTEVVGFTVVSTNYGEVIEIAKNEFNTVFAEREGLEITETLTMARTDDNSNVVVQFSYTSDSGDGVYGFEFLKDENGNYDILQQGDDVTIDSLVGE